MSHPKETVDDCCRVCSYVFENKKRKGNRRGEFLKIFEVFDQKVQADDGLSHALCDTCHERNCSQM